jgi:hypothetical protein
MRAEETLHFAKERRSIGAFGVNQFVASRAGRQFNCPGEHIFGAGGGFVHRAREPTLTLTSAPTSASAKIIDPFCPPIPHWVGEGPVMNAGW